VLQQQINQIRRFLSNAQTPDSVIALDVAIVVVMNRAIPSMDIGFWRTAKVFVFFNVATRQNS
jgi:hypothetical protein